MGRDPRELPLIIESLRLWQGMNQRVEAETGFRQPGIMYLAETAAELGQLESWLDHARQYQLDTRLLTRAEAAELLPGLSGNWAGGLFTASDGKAEPQRAAPAIAEMARRRGAAILTRCAVRGVETAGGRVCRRGHREGADRLRPRSCLPAAPGRGSFAAISASNCRS